MAVISSPYLPPRDDSVLSNQSVVIRNVIDRHLADTEATFDPVNVVQTFPVIFRPCYWFIGL